MPKEFMGIKGVAQLIDRIKSDLNTKQNSITGSAGQFIGFDAQGNPVAQTIDFPESGVTTFNGRRGAVVPKSGDYTAEMVGAAEADHIHPVATQTAQGDMSSADKTKLDGIATGANNYTLPPASSSTRGGVKTGYTTSGKNYAVQLDSSEKMYVNVPWTDNNTTYSAATTSANGLMSSADKTKLDGIATGANKITVNNTLTSTSTTEALSANQGKVLKDAVDAKVPTTRTINGKALSANITLAAADVNAVACATPMTLSVTSDGVLRVTY